MNNRDAVLDVAKGLGIFFVVFAHTYKGTLGSIIYLFHMPLFFFLSGAALTYSSNKRRIGISKFLYTLMLPYLIFSIACFFYWCFIEIEFRPQQLHPLFEGLLGNMDVRLQQFINIFLAFSSKDSFAYNIVLWFLPCLFCTMLIYKSLCRLLGNYVFFGIIVLVTFYFIFQEKLPNLPWCFEISITALPFVFLGNYAYPKIRNLKHSTNAVGVMVAILIIVAIIYFFHPNIDMRLHRYASWWQFYVVAAAFIYVCICFSRISASCEKGIIQWIGKNSLVIMCLHEPIKRILLKILSILIRLDVTAIRHDVLLSLLVVLCVFLTVIPFILFISKYTPGVLGKKSI